MPTNDRRDFTYVCALAIALVFPLSLRIPPLLILATLGVAAVYWLWFAQQYWMLALSLSLAAVGVTMWSGGRMLTVMLAGLAAPALTLSLLRRRGLGAATSIAIATVLPVAAIAVNYTFFANLLHFLAAELREKAYAFQMPGVYTVDQQRLFLDTMNRLADNLPNFLPAVVLCLIVAIYGISLLLGNHLVRSMRVFSRPIPEFRLWKAPEYLVIPLGLAIILLLTNQTPLAIIGWNTLLFLIIVYSISGLSLVEYAMRLRRLSTGTRVIVYALLFLTQIIAGVLLPLAALFDSKFDFRKIRARQLG